MISPQLLHTISTAVADIFGWNFKEERQLDLERGLLETARELGIRETTGEIEKWLTNISWTTRELDILITHLTVGETYFFREKAWLDIFQTHIIPEIIRNRTGKDQYIRIWSAGCCSGEEPYSLAMLLNEKIPDMRNWDITILGTDINQTFLAKAKKGNYTSWSFRETPASRRNRFFSRTGDSWQIDHNIRNLVTFAPLNLVDDQYPAEPAGARKMDVIFCRNVLMYFSHEQRMGVVRRLYQSLAENGWLIVGAVELNNISFSDFTAARFGAYTVYQKTAAPIQQFIKPDQSVKAQPRSSLPVILKPEAKPGSFPIQPSRRVYPANNEEAMETESKAMNFFGNSKYEQCASVCESILAKNPDHIEILTLLVRSKANLGLLKEAEDWARKLALQPHVKANHFYLIANILFEKKDIMSAENGLKRALYLDPHHLMSHFLLGTICNRLENKHVAKKHFQNVKELLGRFEDEEIVPGSEGLTGGRFREIVANLI